MPLKQILSAKSCWLLLISFVLFFAACKKTPDSDNNPPAPTPEALPDLTTKVAAAVVSGFITNENDAAVQSATVEVGGTIVTTDKYGYFEVRNAQVVQNAATVTITKSGYFKTVKTFVATAGKSAFFRIKLLPKTVAGTVNGASGGTVTLSSGMAIALPANAVVNAATNAAYTGAVSVMAQLISAADANLNRIMPGDLRGLNTNGNLRLLTTYGMMAVELTGAGGELLQIATGKKATVTMPIPAAMQASAPATIPLWYFDEAKGLWKEEGSATKSGSNYVGDVSHFSFWNYDVPGTFVQFNCTVLANGGQPVAGALVKISVVNNPSNARFGTTDSAGYVAGAVPDNSQLLLEIFSNGSCANAVHSQQFTTTNTNISLGNITISTASTLAVINGTVTNCSNQPVTNGYIMLQTGSTFTRKQLSNTGTYSFNLLLCNSASTTVTLIGEDIATSQQSNAATYTVSPGNNNIAAIQACGVSTQEFVTYTVNGGAPVNFTVPGDSVMLYGQGNTNYNISAIRIPYNSAVSTDFSFVRTGISAGSIQNLVSFYIPQCGTSSSLPSPIGVNITEYGSIGQFISGNFSGVVQGAPPGNTQFNITCSFRLRRLF